MTIKSYLAIPIAVLGIFTCSISLKAQSIFPPMKKAPAAIAIDGEIEDWKGIPPVLEAKAGLSYTVANDDENIYIVISTIDKAVKRKINAAGLAISINTEGKKRKTYTVTYPLPDLTKFGSLGVSGFKEVFVELVPPDNTFGLKANSKLDDNNIMNYEMAIPLKMIGIKPDKSNELSINICVNGIDSSKPAAGSSTTTQRSGRGGRRGSGGSSDDEDLTESQDFWVKFTLAK